MASGRKGGFRSSDVRQSDNGETSQAVGRSGGDNLESLGGLLEESLFDGRARVLAAGEGHRCLFRSAAGVVLI